MTAWKNKFELQQGQILLCMCADQKIPVTVLGMTSQSQVIQQHRCSSWFCRIFTVS